jgi:integrase/recombinase XerD
VSPRPAAPPDLAGRWLSKFFASHLAGERAASPKTISSYRDAIKLLLTWFRDAEQIPPEKLRLADIDRARVLRFLDWLEAERGCSASSRNQRLAVIKSFCRYTAVEQPGHLDQVTQILAIRQKNTPAPQLGHLTGDEVKALLAEPGTASPRAVRDTVLLALAYDTGARVQELCDLNVTDIRRGSPMTAVIHGKGSKVRYVPVMGPTAQLMGGYLDHRGRHPGVGADTDPLFTGPNHSRLTRSGVAKLLARHVRAVRARDPGWAPGLSVTPHTLRRTRAMHPMALLLGDLPGVEQVELDAAGDPGDAGLAGPARREVSGFFGLAGTGPAGAAADEEAGHEDLQQERGQGQVGLVRGGKPRL